MIRVFRVHLASRTLLLAASEALLSVALFALAVGGRSGAWPENGLVRVGAVTTILVLCMYYYDLYDSLVLRSLRAALTRLPEVLGTACLALALLYLAEPNMRLRLATVLLGMALVGLAIALVRRFFLAVTRSPRLAERLLVVGRGPLAAELSRRIEERPEFGIRIVGVVSNLGDAALAPDSSRPERRIDGCILTDGQGSGPGVAPPGVERLDGVELYEVLTGKVWLEDLASRNFRTRNGKAASSIAGVGARLAAVVVSLCALVAAAPLLALIATAIWLDSGRPVIFRQRRIGHNGRSFTLYKFRTMHNGPHGRFRPARHDDERFTRVGRWLRRTRLDELPQLGNILRGEMSFVGPRPFAWEEERRWAREIPFYARRWSVKPGVTGWAQIRRGYCATKEDNVEKLAYDLFYVKNRSLGLDLLILFETTKILLQGRGAR